MNYRAGQLLAVWDCNVLITLKALNTFPVLMREGGETLQEAVACPNPLVGTGVHRQLVPASSFGKGRVLAP